MEETATRQHEGQSAPRLRLITDEDSLITHLFMMDGPNMDMSLGNVVGRKPRPSDRPDYRVLRNWLVARAGSEAAIERCVFLNRPHPPSKGYDAFVQMLLGYGNHVKVKPKNGDSDIDEDMLQHLHRRVREGALREVILASHDVRNFLAPLEHYAAEGLEITVLGFEDYAGRLASSARFEFIDLRDIPGLFRSALPRLRNKLDDLPEEGGWLSPEVNPGA